MILKDHKNPKVYHKPLKMTTITPLFPLKEKKVVITLPALTWTSRDWILPSSFSAMHRYVCKNELKIIIILKFTYNMGGKSYRI
jgi:hypothetical protein